MTTIKWLGEDTETHAGPTFMIWNGVKLIKDVDVEVADEHMIRKAKLNPHMYVVTESTKAPDAPAPKPKEAPVAKKPETKAAPKAAPKVEAKPAESKPAAKDPHDYPPVKKHAPKKQVRKPKAKTHAHAHR